MLAELEELEQQDLEEKLLDVGPAVELPSVPSALPSEPSRGMMMMMMMMMNEFTLSWCEILRLQGHVIVVSYSIQK